MDLKSIVERAPNHIREQFVYQKHPKDSFLMFAGEANDYLYILTKGSAEVYCQNYEGTILSLSLFHAYNIFGEIEIFNPDAETRSIIAKTSCESIRIHKKIVFEWLKADFDFNLFIIKELAKRISDSSVTASTIALLTIKERILYSIYSHYKIGDLNKLSKKNLIAEVYTSARSLNRSLADCVNEGFITYNNKKFQIVSMDILETYIESLEIE